MCAGGKILLLDFSSQVLSVINIGLYLNLLKKMLRYSKVKGQLV